MTESPYNTFKNWLCDGNLDSILEENVVKAIYIVSALGMFSSINSDITLYLNNTFNNINLYDKNLYDKKLEFFIELKKICIKFNLNKWSFSYVNLKKEKIEYKELLKKYPFLKSFEVDYLVNSYKSHDKNIYNQLTNSNIKTKKTTKAEQKKYFNE